MHLTRRHFMQVGATGAGVVALGCRPRSGLAAPEGSTDGDRVVPTLCGQCPWGCGMLAHIQSGPPARVVKVTGNPAHPLSQGALCARGLAAVAHQDASDRLLQPLVRVGARGEDRFRPASWDEALDRVVQGWQALREKHGPGALALFTQGRGGGFLEHLVRASGSAHVGAPAWGQCRGPRETAFTLTFGHAVGSPERVDLAGARCVVLLGSHLGENTHVTPVRELADAQAAGAELVVVDPRFSVAAGKARFWLPVAPGTDTALLLAWIHVLLAENRVDGDYLARHAVGLEALRAHVQETSPEWAAAHTGVPAPLIRESARFLASFRPATLVYPGRRTAWRGDDTQRLRAVAILVALLGSWGRRGGYLLPGRVDLPRVPSPRYPEAAPRLDRSVHPGSPLGEEVLTPGLREASVAGRLPAGIRGWLVEGTDPLRSLPGPARTREALQQLDLVVVVDVRRSATCAWADVVLPECTFLERTEEPVNPAWREPFVALRQAAVPPRGDSRPGWWMARELAARLGLGAFFPWPDVDALVTARVRAAGLDPVELRRTGVLRGPIPPVCEEEGAQLRFPTDSGKIELYSAALEGLGQDGVPRFTPPEPAPPGMLHLLTGRSPLPGPGGSGEVWVHPSAVSTLLRDGQAVTLVNQDGNREGPLRLRITERIHPACVYLDRPAPALASRLRLDPVSGAAALLGTLVRLEAAA